MSVAALATMLVATTNTALAADQTVELDHDAFVPPRVAVKPGETVTWDNSHPDDEHNVHFEDHSFISPNPPELGPWTTGRPFPTAGAYPYYCEIHGRPGGVGMAGTVYVNSTGTTPRWHSSPSRASPGRGTRHVQRRLLDAGHRRRDRELRVGPGRRWHLRGRHRLNALHHA